MVEVKAVTHSSGNFLELALAHGARRSYDLLDGQDTEELCDAMLDWLGQFHPDRLRRLCEELR